MKIFPKLSTAMKFITPAQYSKSNQAHYVINTSAVNDFTQVHPQLGENDRLLDFGCGTGETTVAMAEGILGNLGKPSKVVGVDISDDMISHCSETHQTANLSFQQLNVSDGESFISSNSNSFSMVSSFSCLHWVPNQPDAVSLFNKVLQPGGKFLFVIAGTHNPRDNILKKEYENMKTEAKWADMLKPTSWMHFKTIHVNNSWMSTVDSNGLGYIEEGDYVKLMENHGFRVDDAKTIPLKYVLNKDFTKNFFKSTLLTSFPELTGDNRNQFFTEFIGRIKEQSQPDADGFSKAYVDGIQIFGEKIKEV